MVRGILVGALLVGCSPPAFECIANDQCVLDGVAGACEADGWCSFPDAACPSGDRYGEYAGDGKAGVCVGGGGSTGIAETSGGSVSSVGSSSGGMTVSSASTAESESVTSTSTNTTTTTTSTSTSTTEGSTGVEVTSSGESSVASSDSGCEPDCPVYGMCGDGMDCPEGACVSIGGGPGTCFPSCEGMACPDGGFCAMSFNACALPCVNDTDCPNGMFCTELPARELACMW